MNAHDTPSQASTPFHDWLSQAKSFWASMSLGAKLAWAFFLFVNFQAVVRQPYVIIFNERRINIWAGLLAGTALLFAWGAVKDKRAFFRSKEFLFTLVLAALVFISGFASPQTRDSVLRSFVLVATGLGGYWCGRILAGDPQRRRYLVQFCTVLLSALLGGSLIGYLFFGSVHTFFDDYRHPQVSMNMLLSFAPLALLLTGVRPQRVIGLHLMLLMALILYLSGLRSAVLLPLALGGVALLIGVVRLRYFIIFAVVVAAACVSFFHFFPDKHISQEHESAYYRAENYPFSLHIVGKRPYTGIGLAGKRDPHLEDYRTFFRWVNRDLFIRELKRIQVAENIVLTFLVSLGAPFTILYFTGVGIIYVGLLRRVRRKEPAEGIPLLALFLPITGGAFHFMLYDGLLHPQACWFFHLLLGLAAPCPVPLGQQAAPLDQGSTGKDS